VSNVVRVEVATLSSPDYAYEIVFNWREINGYLYFNEDLAYTAGRTIRIFYNANHDAVSGDDDVISDDIPTPLLTAMAAYYYYMKEYADAGVDNKYLNNLLERARADKMMAEQKYRVNVMHRDPILN
jgi:hypothetical protein